MLVNKKFCCFSSLPIPPSPYIPWILLCTINFSLQLCHCQSGQLLLLLRPPSSLRQGEIILLSAEQFPICNHPTPTRPPIRSSNSYPPTHQRILFIPNSVQCSSTDVTTTTIASASTLTDCLSDKWRPRVAAAAARGKTFNWTRWWCFEWNPSTHRTLS